MLAAWGFLAGWSILHRQAPQLRLDYLGDENATSSLTRCSEDKFRPQPVWSFEFGATAGLNRQAGGLCAQGLDDKRRPDDPTISDFLSAVAAIIPVAQQDG
jgi:hypothetical protein